MKSITAVLTLCAASLIAVNATPADEFDARVARISYVSGDASYQRGDYDEWSDLRVNTPLVTGDSFYASQGGRAELDLGSGIFVRVDGDTEVELINNTRDITQIGLTGGAIDISARWFPHDLTLEIDTPNGAATLNEPGRYLVDVTDGVARYAVVRGSLSLAVNGEQLDVEEGEALELELDDFGVRYGYTRLPPRTPLQRWAEERDGRYDHAQSTRYVDNSVEGCEDLDDYGTWRNHRTYGRVWIPANMRSDWAPYRVGRWIWQDPYGWTWVSYEPWGWAPYHYGRWVRIGYDWCWVPPPPRGYRGPSTGPRITASYAPALVAFVGGRNWGASVSLGGPAIGWVPLAPNEHYYYAWQTQPRVTNTYVNVNVVNAVTVVNYNTFTSNVVRPIQVEHTQIRRAPVMGNTAIDVAPRRESLVVAPEPRPAPKPAPPVRTQRPMVTRLVPPPKPVSFAQKAPQIERTGKPVSEPVVRQGPVGKPFLQGAQAPAGVKVVSGLESQGKKEMTPRTQPTRPAPGTDRADAGRPPETGRHPEAGRPPESDRTPETSRPPETGRPTEAPPVTERSGAPGGPPPTASQRGPKGPKKIQRDITPPPSARPRPAAPPQAAPAAEPPAMANQQAAPKAVAPPQANPKDEKGNKGNAKGKKPKGKDEPPPPPQEEGT